MELVGQIPVTTFYIVIGMIILALTQGQKPKKLILPAIMLAMGVAEAIASEEINKFVFGWCFAGLILQVGSLMLPSQKRG